MKVRKLAVALALAGGLGSSVAQALGLGEIELQSYLNEPLDAEINLPQSRGVDPGDVFVNIAPESAYETVGLSRNQFLSKLRFQVVTQSDGSLAVNVSSREPLREPYLNFLLELTWPNGRLMREYAVLVDPPVYAEESGVEERVSAPAVSSNTQQPSSSSRSAESIRRQTQAEQSLSRGYQGNTFGPTGASDTLWTIASSVRPNDSVSTQQVMLAIQDLNPDAFIGNNINRLKRGEVLRVPTLDQIQSRTRAEATQVVSRQNAEFQSPQRTVDATDSQQVASGAAQAASGGDELKLLVADNESPESSDGGSAGGDGELPGGVDAGTAVAMEELESARRENDELNSRVNDLQDQVETLQRLLELKNSQLADMQQMAGESDEASGDGAAPVEGESAEQGSGDVEGAESGVAGTDEAGAEETTETVEPEGAESPEAEASAMDEGMAEDAGDEAVADSESGAAEIEGADDVTEGASAEPEGGVDDAAMGAAEEPDTATDEGAAEPEQAAAPAQVEPAPEAASQEPKPAAQPPVQEKGFPGNIIDAITGNILYQVALGGGLIVLLLLLLSLARRNANREKAFYEQLNSETGEDSDSFELSLDDEDTEQGASDDALAEADSYLAYGRHDQAAQTLETAISREPSRTDLRLKLLAVYADNQDRESFEKQYGEIEALGDDEAMASATDLRSKLDEAESMPSIDDLESQLRSDSFGASEAQTEESGPEAEAEKDSQLSDELLADQYDSEQEEQVENEFGELDTDFADFDLNEVESSEASADAESAESEEAPERKEGDNSIEFDLSGLSLESEEESAAEGQESGSEEETDYSSLEMDLGEPSDDKADDTDWSDDLGLELEDSLDEEPAAGESAEETAEPVSAPAEESVDSDTDALDESFLDELDAELDKVAGEEDELGGEEMEKSSLDDLELDVSDEDLALMEEFSDSADTEQGETPALDEELNLEDTLGEGDVLGESSAASPEEEVAGTEELEDLGSLDELAEQDDQGSETTAEKDEVPVASEEIGDDVNRSDAVDIDESELGDDDDFDFLAGTDEAATKLDLARAYIEMGDSDGARDILEEVALEGNEDQKTEAQDLLKNLS